MPKPGSAELPQGDFTITYPLGDKGEKSLEFASDAIVVRIRHAGAFMESIPLLERGEEQRPGFRVVRDTPAAASREAANTQVGRRRLVIMRLKARDTLTDRLQFAR